MNNHLEVADLMAENSRLRAALERVVELDRRLVINTKDQYVYSQSGNIALNALALTSADGHATPHHSQEI